MSHLEKKLEIGSNITFKFDTVLRMNNSEEVGINYKVGNTENTLWVSKKSYNKLKSGKFVIKKIRRVERWAGGPIGYVSVWVVEFSRKGSHRAVASFGQIIQMPLEFVVASPFKSISLEFSSWI